MKIEIQNNDIVMSDIIPSPKIAEFSDNVLTKEAKETFALEHNIGIELVVLFRSFRDEYSLYDIRKLLDFIEQASKIINKYDTARYNIARNNRVQ